MRKSMVKKSMAMALAVALLFSVCGGTIFAKKATTYLDSADDSVSDAVDSGGFDLEKEDKALVNTDITMDSGYNGIPYRERDDDKLLKKMLEERKRVEKERERYLPQLTDKNRMEIDKEFEEIKLVFQQQSEMATRNYQPTAEQSLLLKTSGVNTYDISSSDLHIQNGTNAGTIKVTHNGKTVDNINPSTTALQVVGSTNQHIIYVDTSANRAVIMIFNGVNIRNNESSNSPLPSCMTLSTTAVVYLTITGNNELFSEDNGAGIEVPKGAKITIGGTGSLNAVGGSLSAGIGGYMIDCGDITLQSGTIIASTYELSNGVNDGSGGAAIGGGFSGGCGTITINGGNITANNYSGIGTSIGTGGSGTGGNIIINGGIINANTTIGSGFDSTINSVNMNGGTINVIDNTYNIDSLIGGKIKGNTNIIKITNGTINALTKGGTGIGASFNGSFGSVNISNATVNVSSLDNRVGIGGAASPINIESGTVTVLSKNAPAIGGVYDAETGINVDGIINIGSSANVTALTITYPSAITKMSGSANVLNFKFNASAYGSRKAILKNASGSAVYTMPDELVSSGYCSLALTVPAGNYSLYINDEKQAGVKNDAFTSVFNATQGLSPYSNVRADLPDEMLYGRLNFSYPVEYMHSGIFDYAGHLGLDISAPKNDPIFSVDYGTVVKAGLGANNGQTTGFYISIVNDTLDPTKATPSNMITRYLHINVAENVFVKAGDKVYKSKKIGLVGSRGYYKGTRLNHLHLDANSSGITVDGPGDKYIPPKQFWPGRFHNATSSEQYPGYESDWGGTRNANILANDQNSTVCDLTDQELLELGGYYDLSLIKMIGSTNFENWLSEHPYSTVYDLIKDFEITNKQLKETLAEHVYAEYMKYWPES